MNEYNYLSIAMLLCAVAVYAWRIRSYDKARERTKFPSVTGTVVFSDVQEKVVEDDDKDTVSSRSYSYIPVVRYAYTVDGKGYANDRYSVLDQPGFSLPQSAQAFVERHPAGSAVTVHYNPRSPGDSFIDNRLDAKKVDSTTWIAIGVLVVLAVLFSFVD